MKTKQPKALGKVAKRGVAWSFLREGVTEILVFPAAMVLARLLAPREIGMAAAGLFFTQLAVRLGELGFNAAIVRAKVIDQTHLATVFTINLLVGFGMFVTLSVFAPWVATFYGVPETSHVVRFAAIGFLIAPFGAVPAALIARNMHFRQGAMVDWFNTLTFAAGGVVLAWFGFSYMSPVYAKLAAVTVQTGSRIAFARWRPSIGISKSALREIFPFGAGMHAKHLLDYLANNLDNVVVGKFFGMAALGLYDKAFSTMSRVLARFNAAGPNVSFRIFAIIHDQPERFARAYSRVVTAATLLVFPIFALLIAAAPDLMTVLFGERWRPAAAPFQVLCLAGCLRVLNSYAGAAAQAAGRIWSQVLRQAVYTLLIVVTIVALRGFGLVGAALGVLIATLFMTVTMHVLLKRVAPVDWSNIVSPVAPAVAGAVGVAGVALLAAYAVRVVVPSPASWVLLTCQVLAAATFYAAFILFSPFRAVRSLVSEVVSDILPRGMASHSLVQRYLNARAAA
jgi:O-antigen/teichoic acid export membrane protein